jgi:two-component SAPR family response regulator
MKVLLVEDSEPVRRLVEMILSDAGHEIASAGTAAEAVRFALEMPSIDLLVSDVVLDCGTGFDVQTFVQHHHRAVRTIFITGYALPDGESDDLGAKWLQKPFRRDELLSMIDQWKAAAPECPTIQPRARIKPALAT